MAYSLSASQLQSTCSQRGIHQCALQLQAAEPHIRTAAVNISALASAAEPDQSNIANTENQLLVSALTAAALTGFHSSEPSISKLPGCQGVVNSPGGPAVAVRMPDAYACRLPLRACQAACPVSLQCRGSACSTSMPGCQHGYAWLSAVLGSQRARAMDVPSLSACPCHGCAFLSTCLAACACL